MEDYSIKFPNQMGFSTGNSTLNVQQCVFMIKNTTSVFFDLYAFNERAFEEFMGDANFVITL